jgi:hypothetical protein
MVCTEKSQRLPTRKFAAEAHSYLRIEVFKETISRLLSLWEAND